MLIKVDNELITQLEIDSKWKEIKKKLNSLKKNLSSDQFEEISLNQAKEELIKEKLLLVEAEKKIPEINYQEIKKKYQDIKGHFEKNQPSSDIAPENITQKEFNVKKNIENYLKIAKLINLWLKDLPVPSTADLKLFFKNNHHLFNLTDYGMFTRISTSYKNKAQMEELYYALAQKKIDEITSFLNQKKIFQVNKNNLIQQGYLLKEVEEIIFNLKVGEPSQIIHSQNELFIFIKSINLQDDLENSFKLMKSVVKKIYFQLQKEKIVNNKVIQLKEKAKIIYQENS